MRHLKPQSIPETWRMLNRSIYTGERLRSNLRALTAAGIFTSGLSVLLIVINLLSHQRTMLAAAAVTLVFGAACAYFAGVKKRRDLAILMPTLFCAVMFSVYTVTGAGDGTAILWTFLLPVGISYFVSVKYGIILSIYYTVFFVIVFYTPLCDHMSAYYSQSFSSRFPLVYASTAILTAIAMVQYHRGVLLENEYAEQLTAEVEKQTRVARERAERLEALSEETVQTLAVTIDAKDRYTNGHSFRVSWYAAALARGLGWPDEEISELEREALLHDVGKIGVPDDVLNKPGRLTDEEFVIIKSHTTVGGGILSRSRSLLSAAQVARYHHERYDGNGYPEGLRGEDIPLHARLVAIADAYDAMRSDRIYRKGLPQDVIREELVRGSGKQFDPALLPAFLELCDSGALDQIAAREIGNEQF